MRAIWKYPIEVDDYLTLTVNGPGNIMGILPNPERAHILDVYVEVDPTGDHGVLDLNLAVVGTGHYYMGGDLGLYVATVRDGVFVWHVFRKEGQ